jgi:antitoxin ParD1/3/4
MATRDFVLTDHSATLMEQGQSEDADQLVVLRKAAQEGIADIDAGRFKTFESRQGLRNHLQGMADKVRTVK